MILSKEKQSIGTVPCPTCMLCASEGELVYQGLRDRLFSAPGTWNYRRCNDSNCGILWLDPTPVEADLGHLYETYFTHDREPASAQDWRHRLYRKSEESYLAKKYGYGATSLGFSSRVLRHMLHLWPSRIDRAGGTVMYLHRRTGGRLLDIGCGRGSQMEAMRKRGWKCEGIDVDPAAVEIATSRGLDARVGAVEDRRYAENSFDAIIMSHVLEHVMEPFRLLTECQRILKPAGQMTVVTPNALSWGSRVFRDAWFGLEPPRHLRVFTPAAIARLALRLGHCRARVRTSTRGAALMFFASRAIRRTGRYNLDRPLSPWQRLGGEIVELWEWARSRADANLGEEIVLLVEKLAP